MRVLGPGAELGRWEVGPHGRPHGWLCLVKKEARPQPAARARKEAVEAGGEGVK